MGIDFESIRQARLAGWRPSPQDRSDWSNQVVAPRDRHDRI